MRRPQEVRVVTPEAFLKQRIPIVDIPLSLSSDLRKLAIFLKSRSRGRKAKNDARQIGNDNRPVLFLTNKAIANPI